MDPSAFNSIDTYALYVLGGVVGLSVLSGAFVAWLVL